MRAPELITALQKNSDHDFCGLLFQFEDSDVPLIIEFAENIERALSMGWKAVGLIFVDQIGREEVWYSHTIPGADAAFMSGLADSHRRGPGRRPAGAAEPGWSR